jgi:bifunctional non-homologous end joining protein LigD
LFLVADKLKGEWMLRRVEGETWAIYRPTVDESGLAFQMSPIAALPAGTVPEEKLPARRESTATTASRKRNSADSALDLSKLPAANPAFVVPMECRLMPEVPDGARWLYELKLDGYRAIAINDGTATHLYSRYGHAFDARFPAIISSLQVLPPGHSGRRSGRPGRAWPSQLPGIAEQPLDPATHRLLRFRHTELQGSRLTGSSPGGA